MKVVFLTPLGGKDVLYLPNEVYDLDKSFAKRLIDKGICIKDDTVEEKKPVVKAVVSNKTKVSKKKGKK